MTRRISHDGSPARNLTIRVYDEDRAAWQAMADESGERSLGTLIARVMNAEIERVKRSKRSK